jgi:protein O-mannosyl-transferase
VTGPVVLPQPPAGAGEGPHWLFGTDRTASLRRMLLLALFPALVFVGTLTFDFVLDDNLVVLEDPAVAEPLHLGAVFGQPVRIQDVSLGFFRPVIALTYRADRILWGANPAGYHLANVLWHLLATFLVYGVALRTGLSLPAAWMAAMLFSVLPVHTETVAWVQGRVDLVPTALVLLAFLALLTACRDAGAARWCWAGLAGAAFFAALLAKESVASIPLAWAMWEFAAVDRRAWRERLPGAIVRLGALGAAGVLYGIFRQYAVGGTISFTTNALSLSQRLTAAIALVGEYGRRLFFPDLSMNLFRGLPVPLPAERVLLGLLACAALAAGLRYTWKRQRCLFPWVAWLPITLIPALLFVVFAYIPGTPLLVADRYAYLPSVAWCILAGGLLAGFLMTARRAWRTLLVGFLLAGYAGMTLVRLQPWGDPVEFLQAVTRQPGLSAWVQTVLTDNLGLAYLEHHDFERARRQFAAAAALSPGEASPRNNMGVLLIREGRPAEATPWLHAAIRLNPALPSAYGNLGVAYETLGDRAAARAAFEGGLRIAPASTWLARGLARVGTDAPAGHVR